MKKLIVTLLISIFATSLFASEVIKASNESELKILDLIVGDKQTYSKTSELQAKVIELLAGDGMNPTRMVLILSTGNPMEENNIFTLDRLMLEVTRITFIDKDLLLINYVQDDFDAKDEVVQVKRSMEIQVLRNDKGELSGDIRILK